MRAWASITAIMNMMDPAMTNSGFILTPWASSWKNLISPALAAGMDVVLSRFFLLIAEPSTSPVRGLREKCLHILGASPVRLLRMDQGGPSTFSLRAFR